MFPLNKKIHNFSISTQPQYENIDNENETSYKSENHLKNKENKNLKDQIIFSPKCFQLSNKIYKDSKILLPASNYLPKINFSLKILKKIQNNLNNNKEKIGYLYGNQFKFIKKENHLEPVYKLTEISYAIDESFEEKFHQMLSLPLTFFCMKSDNTTENPVFLNKKLINDQLETCKKGLFSFQNLDCSQGIKKLSDISLNEAHPIYDCEIFLDQNPIDLIYLYNFRLFLFVENTQRNSQKFGQTLFVYYPNLNFSVQMISQPFKLVSTPLTHILTKKSASTGKNSSANSFITASNSSGRNKKTSIKFGFLTLDQNHRMCPLMASDPVSLQVPLIGVWIYGVNYPRISENELKIDENYLIWGILAEFVKNQNLLEKYAYDERKKNFFLTCFSNEENPKFYEVELLRNHGEQKWVFLKMKENMDFDNDEKDFGFTHNSKTKIIDIDEMQENYERNIKKSAKKSAKKTKKYLSDDENALKSQKTGKLFIEDLEKENNENEPNTQNIQNLPKLKNTDMKNKQNMRNTINIQQIQNMKNIQTVENLNQNSYKTQIFENKPNIFNETITMPLPREMPKKEELINYLSPRMTTAPSNNTFGMLSENMQLNPITEKIFQEQAKQLKILQDQVQTLQEALKKTQNISQFNSEKENLTENESVYSSNNPVKSRGYMSREISNFFQNNNKMLINQSTNTTFLVDKETNQCIFGKFIDNSKNNFNINCEKIVNTTTIENKKTDTISTSTDPMEIEQTYLNTSLIKTENIKNIDNKLQENLKEILEKPIEENYLKPLEITPLIEDKVKEIPRNPSNFIEKPHINEKELSPIQKKERKVQNNSYFMRNDFLDSLKKRPLTQKELNESQEHKKNDSNLKSSLTIPKITFEKEKFNHSDSSEDEEIKKIQKKYLNRLKI